jgi:hypothetical protein
MDMVHECEDVHDVIKGGGFETGMSRDILAEINTDWLDVSAESFAKGAISSHVSYAFDNTPELRYLSPTLRAQILALALSPLNLKIRSVKIGDKNDTTNKKNHPRQRSPHRKNRDTE